MAIEITSSQATLQVDRGVKGSAGSRAQKEVQAPASVFSQEVESLPAQPLRPEKTDPTKEQRLLEDSESLAKLVEMVNERPQIRDRSLQFSVHENTGKMLVRVYDSKTDELIRQFPPNELLVIAERIQEVLAESPSGIMLQEKA